MNVLIIPEDFPNDQHILKPIVTAIFSKLGKSQAKIRVCQDPRLGGISEVLKWENLEYIFDRYKMVDLFLICVDRDGQTGRETALLEREQWAKGILAASDRKLLTACAHQEIEVWVLAGHDDLPWAWQEIRQEMHPKEMYFDFFSKQRGLFNAPANGRERLTRESVQRYDRIRQLCPEVGKLENRIREWIEK